MVHEVGRDMSVPLSISRLIWLAVVGLGAIAWPATADGSITRAAFDGERVNEFFIDEGAVGASGDLAIGGGYIFWVSADGTSIARARQNGTRVDRDFVTGLSAIRGLAANDRYLYWGGNSIGRADLRGTNVEPAFMTPSGGADDVAATDAYLYWTSDEGIGRAGLNGEGEDPSFIETGVTAGPPPHPYYEGTYAPTSVTVNSKYAYFTYSTYHGGKATSDVGRANLDGRNVVGVLHGGGLRGTYYGPGLAAAEDRVFVGVFSGLDDTSVGAFSTRFATDSPTGPLPSSWPTTDPAFGVAVSDRHVYWTQRAAGGLNCTLDNSRRDQRQHGRDVRFKVWLAACEQVRVRASGRAKVGAMHYKLKPTAKTVAPSSSSFALRPTRVARRPVLAALKEGDRVVARIVLRITDTAGNSTSRAYLVRLERG